MLTTADKVKLRKSNVEFGGGGGMGAAQSATHE